MSVELQALFVVALSFLVGAVLGRSLGKRLMDRESFDSGYWDGYYDGMKTRQETAAGMWTWTTRDPTKKGNGT